MRFIMVSTFFMAWVFYEMSGGSDFVPPSQRDSGLVAAAEAAELSPAKAARAASGDAIATRAAASPAVDGLSFATMKTAPARQQPTDQAELLQASVSAEPRNVGEGSLKVIALARTEPTEPETKPLATVEEASVEKAAVFTDPDMRRVTGSTVNMRNGPGTRYNVLDQLNAGDLVEVLQDPGNGWVKLRAKDSGRVGWMSDSLLAFAE